MLTGKEGEIVEKIMRLASEYFKAGNYPAAIKQCDGAIAYDAKNEEAWRLSGNCCEKLKQYAEAVKRYDSALKLKKSNLALAGSGRCYEKLRQFDKAIDFYSQALEIEKNPENIKRLWIRKAECWEKLDRWDEALKCYRALLDENPNSIIAWEKSAECNKELKQFDEVIKCYSEILEIDPTNLDAAKKIAGTYQYLGDTNINDDKALDYFQKALDCYNKPPLSTASAADKRNFAADIQGIKTRQALAVQMQGERLRAKADVILTPREHKQEGTASEPRDYEAAEKLYRDSLKRSPENRKEILIKIAETYIGRRKYPDALYNLDEAHILAVEEVRVRRQQGTSAKQILEKMGDVYASFAAATVETAPVEAEGRYREALQKYDQAGGLKSTQKYKQVQRNLSTFDSVKAKALEREGDDLLSQQKELDPAVAKQKYDEALGYFKKAKDEQGQRRIESEKYEKVIAIYLERAKKFMANRDYDNAEEQYDQALAINPKDNDALYKKAELLLKLSEDGTDRLDEASECIQSLDSSVAKPLEKRLRQLRSEETSPVDFSSSDNDEDLDRETEREADEKQSDRTPKRKTSMTAINAAMKDLYEIQNNLTGYDLEARAKAHQNAIGLLLAGIHESDHDTAMDRLISVYDDLSTLIKDAPNKLRTSIYTSLASQFREAANSAPLASEKSTISGKLSEIYHHLGRASIERGHGLESSDHRWSAYAEALSYFNEAIAVEVSLGNTKESPAHSNALASKIEALVLQADIDRNLKQYNSALKRYDEALEINATSRAALVGKGSLFLAQRRYSEAIPLFEQVTGNPQDPLFKKAKVGLAFAQQQKSRRKWVFLAGLVVAGGLTALLLVLAWYIVVPVAVVGGVIAAIATSYSVRPSAEKLEAVEKGIELQPKAGKSSKVVAPVPGVAPRRSDSPTHVIADEDFKAEQSSEDIEQQRREEEAEFLASTPRRDVQQEQDEGIDLTELDTGPEAFLSKTSSESDDEQDEKKGLLDDTRRQSVPSSPGKPPGFTARRGSNASTSSEESDTSQIEIKRPGSEPTRKK